MFYVLFTYSKGQRERDFRGFRSEHELIEFLHKDYEKIDIVQIISVEKSYRLGLIETEELAKSALIAQEIETDLPDPAESKTGMEKMADQVEEEMTDEEILKKNKEALQRGEKAIAAAEKDLEKTTGFIPKPVAKSIKRHYTQNEDRKKNWKLCPDCHKNKIAPWNKAGRCSECQQYKKIPKLKLDKTNWALCPKCVIRKVAPWSTTGICSYCQGNRGKKK